jgi:hypothetical protein
MKNLQNFDNFLNEEAPMNSQPTPPDEGGKLGFFGRWAKQLLGIPNTVPAKFNVDTYPEWKKIKDALIPTQKFTLHRHITQPSFTYNDVSDDWSSESLYSISSAPYCIVDFPYSECEGADPDFSKVSIRVESGADEYLSIKNPDLIIARVKKIMGK